MPFFPYRTQNICTVEELRNKYNSFVFQCSNVTDKHSATVLKPLLENLSLGFDEYN